MILKKSQVILLIIIFFACDISYAESDSLYVLATSLIMIDWAQSRKIVNDPNYDESNILLGKSPSSQTVDAYFYTAMLATFFIYEGSNKLAKKRFLYGLIAIETLTISRNYQLGLRINF